MNAARSGGRLAGHGVPALTFQSARGGVVLVAKLRLPTRESDVYLVKKGPARLLLTAFQTLLPMH